MIVDISRDQWLTAKVVGAGGIDKVLESMFSGATLVGADLAVGPPLLAQIRNLAQQAMNDDKLLTDPLDELNSVSRLEWVTFTLNALFAGLAYGGKYDPFIATTERERVLQALIDGMLSHISDARFLSTWNIVPLNEPIQMSQWHPISDRTFDALLVAHNRSMIAIVLAFDED